MATLLQDTFDNDTHADGTNLTAHTMDIGGGWIADTGVIKIYSNKASGQDGTSGVSSFYVSNAGNADCVISVNFDVPLSYAAMGIVGRRQDANNSWAFFWESDDIIGNVPYIAIYELVAGSYTLQAGNQTITASQNTTQTMTVTFSGTSIDMRVTTTGADGHLTFTSSDYQTQTYHGIITYFNSGIGYLSVPLDNFLVTGAGGAVVVPFKRPPFWFARR